MTDPSSNMPRISSGDPEAATQRFPAAGAATEQFSAAYPEQAGAAEPTPPSIMIRRARPNVFVPPQPQDPGQVISRDVGRSPKISQPKIPRNRQIAGNLPGWDPLPPGEIHVIHRGGRSGQ